MHPKKKILIFPKKLYPKIEPDLAYYQNSSRPIRTFLYFPKKATVLFWWMLIKTGIKKFLIIQDDCWFSLIDEFSQLKRKIKNLSQFLQKKVTYTCPLTQPSPEKTKIVSYNYSVFSFYNIFFSTQLEFAFHFLVDF